MPLRPHQRRQQRHDGGAPLVPHGPRHPPPSRHATLFGLAYAGTPAGDAPGEGRARATADRRGGRRVVAEEAAIAAEQVALTHLEREIADRQATLRVLTAALVDFEGYRTGDDGLLPLPGGRTWVEGEGLRVRRAALAAQQHLLSRLRQVGTE